MFLEHPSSATSARLLVTMPLLFREPRLPYFFDQIRCFAEFMVASVDVAIITDAAGGDQQDLVRNLTRKLEATGITFTVETFWNKYDPKELTWKHKELILDKFLDPARQYTHFVYLEDDMRFTFLNFSYFLKYRPLLRRFGVIPSFLRYEYNLAAHDLFLTDFAHATAPDLRDAIGIEALNFVTPDYPYCAMYVLDRDLATEFAATASFDMEDSKALTPWKSTERSAMGLCFENIPDGRTSRFVVPLRLPDMLPYYHCLVHHLPNNFANTMFGPNYPAFGKTPVCQGFALAN